MVNPLSHTAIDANRTAAFARERLPGAWLNGLVLLGVVAAFSPIMLNGWILYDDEVNVIDNPFFFPVSWRSLQTLWSQSYMAMYIPLSYSLFAAESVLSRWLAGVGPSDPIRPLVFHVTSLALHSAGVVLVGRILGRLGASPLAALVGMLLFAIHPLQVESVAWVSEQRGLLAAVFALSAVNLFLDALRANIRKSGSRRTAVSWRYAAASALFVAALLAKPTAIVVPLLVIALTAGGTFVNCRTLTWLLLPWFAAAGISAAMTRAVQPADLTAFHTPMLLRPIIAGDALAFYGTKLAVPIDLCFNYGHTPERVLFDPFSWSRAIVAAVFVTAVCGLHRLATFRRPLAISLAALLPVLGFVPFLYQNHSTVADRYAYLALLGPALAAARLFDARPLDRRLRSLWVAAASVLALSWAAMSFRQTTLWRDAGTVATHACNVAPHAEAAWVLLSGYSLLDGDPQRAAMAAEQALRIVPTNATALINAAAAAARLDDAQAAVASLRRLEQGGVPAAEIAAIFFKRGCQLLAEGRAREAAVDFSLALEAQPRHHGALTNLGAALTRLGRYDRAIEVLRWALENDTADVPALVTLGNALVHAGRPLDAIDAYDRALAAAPDDADTLLNRAQAQRSAGNASAAEADVARARQLLDRLAPGSSAP